MTPDIQFNRSAISAGECVSTAWEMVKAQYGIYLGVSLLAWVMISCIPCLNIFLLGPVMGGVFYVGLRDMRGEPIDFGMMFKGFENFVPLMVIGLIQSVPGIISQVVQYTYRFAELAGGSGGRRGASFFQSTSVMPDFAIAGVTLVVLLIVIAIFIVFGFFWWAVFFFAIPLAMDRGLPVVDAIKLSARAAMANLGGLLLLMIVEIAVALLGAVMLCVGALLISVPVIFIANVVAYRLVFPRAEDNFNYSPPPPSTYRDWGPGGIAA